jgi:hypothetical protein
VIADKIQQVPLLNRAKHILLIIAGILFVGVLYSLSRPEYSSLNPGNNSATIFFPLVLYSYTPGAVIGSAWLASSLTTLWIVWNAPANVRSGCLWGIPVVFLFACCVSATSIDKDFDFFELFREEWHLHQTLAAHRHVYHYVLQEGYFGFYSSILFECDQTGRLCRAVLRQHLSDRPGPKFHIEEVGNGIKIMFEDELVVQYILAS